jgi:gamma-glutamylcyclotransferase (GGCT)/AIG2-like uncharacterized protein YtfP
MLYFAYGSNLDWAQMRERCPSARFVCIAKLPEHRLDFTRQSTKKDREGGVADVVPDAHQNVWGVVYQIEETEIDSLDRCEGFRPGRRREENSYNREERHVFRDGDERQPLVAFLYFVSQKGGPFRPHPKYKRFIVEGAKHWHLPHDYIAKLERIETKVVIPKGM